MEDHGVGSWIERRSRTAPERVALVHGTTRRTYTELTDRIHRLAASWRSMGVRRGDRLAWRGPNHPAFLESLFAAAKLGAVLTPVNHQLDEATVAELFARYAPVLSIEHDVAPAGAASCLVARIGVGPTDGDASFEALATAAPASTIDENVDPGDVCLMPHTSGTTGRPRGVMLTHANITANVVNVLSVADLCHDDVTVAIAPFFRTGGTGVNVLPVLFKGGTVVVPDRMGPEELFGLVESERVTVGFANPDLLDALVRSPQWATADLSSLRWILTGGAPVPERLVRTYHARGLPLLQGYGLSEAAPVALLLDPDHALAKIGSAGTPPMLVDVTTTRPDGTPCAPGEPGELRVRGPNVMAGYWDDEEATRAALDDGWLRTRDAARIDEDGYVWIVDRLADAFEVAGRLVFPGDVERVLLEHPAVRDVGVDAHGAFVVLELGADATAEELLALCRDHLPAAAVPVKVTFVDRLPRNSVGKLVRQDLR